MTRELERSNPGPAADLAIRVERPGGARQPIERESTARLIFFIQNRLLFVKGTRSTAVGSAARRQGKNDRMQSLYSIEREFDKAEDPIVCRHRRSAVPFASKSPVPAKTQSEWSVVRKAPEASEVPFMNQTALAAGVAPEDIGAAVAVEVA